MRSTLPVLETERLIIREIEYSDALDMFEYARLSFIGPSAGWEPHLSVFYTKDIIGMFHKKKSSGQLGVYSVVLKESNKMIGTVELHSYIPNHKAELGYTINPSFWGKGYAVEASKKIIEWGFDDLHLKRIECEIFTKNIQSKRVCEKLGLEYEGIKKKGYMLYNGQVYDVICYSITDDLFYERIRSNTWY